MTRFSTPTLPGYTMCRDIGEHGTNFVGFLCPHETKLREFPSKMQYHRRLSINDFIYKVGGKQTDSNLHIL